MKRILQIGIIVLAILFTQKSFATDLQGQVVRYDSYSRTYTPVQGLRVYIWVFNGAQWVNWSYTVTGGDGMYYFANMSPGVSFQIQINGRYCFQKPLFLANVPLINIPQIVI
jgi:hypothetical protein